MRKAAGFRVLFLVRVKLLPQGIEQLLHAGHLPGEVEPAQQALKAGGSAVFFRGSVLGHTGLAGVAAPLEHSQLLLCEERLQQLLLPELCPGRDILDLFHIELACGHPVVPCQTGAHQQFQHAVPHKGQRQRVQLTGVDGFGFVHKKIPFVSALTLSVSAYVQVGGTATAKVNVTNTGDVAGKSVVQLYVQSPYTEGGLEKSAIQLIGYGKTEVLDPGASEEVTIEFDPLYMASYDEDAVKADGTQGAWSLEAGDYYFAIGNGAHEALNNVLANKNGNEDGLVKIAETDEINADNAIKWNLADTDIETYSAGVENQLQDMDINNLIEDTVEYTTRSDWSKGWEPIESLTPTEAMMVGLTDQLYELTENEGDGSGITWGADNGMKLIDMMQFDENGNYAGALDFDDPMWDQLMNQITLDEAIQFIEKAGDDFENIDSIQLARTYANDGPLGYTGDQVGGYFVRWSKDLSEEDYYTEETDDKATYRMATMPTEPIVAATFNKDLVEREGELLGEDGLWANESSLFAPGLNLHRTVYCGRNHEYYSEDSVLTAYMGNALCVGLKSKGTMAEPKHFAFNHQEANRSGLSTFMTEQAARENELRGFMMCMSSNNAQGVMTAFNRAGTSFVGAYKNLLENITRNEWGYQGWFVTDMINGADYMNWRDVTAAGGGGTLTSSAYDTSTIGAMAESKKDIEKDVNFQQMMKKNIKYFLYQLVQSNAMNGISSTTEIQAVRTWYQNALTGAEAAFAVLTLLFLIMTILKTVKPKKEA